MSKQFVVCLDGNAGHLDSVYGPFPTIEAAEEWAEKRGFKDQPPAFWTWFILELEGDLNPKFFDKQHFAKDKI